MDRTEYLKMAQRCSVLDFLNIPEDLLVCYNGIKYIPFGYEMKFKKGNPTHNAILRDIRARSIVYADLSKVDKYLKL